MNTDWQYQHEPHARLKWARLTAGYPTATAAAESLGMNKDTYSAYEREPGKSKHTELDHQRAIQFGRKYKVSWEWLLVGQGTPFAVVTDAQQKALRAMSQAPEAEQERAARMVVELLRTGTSG